MRIWDSIMQDHLSSHEGRWTCADLVGTQIFGSYGFVQEDCEMDYWCGDEQICSPLLPNHE